eukprot:Gb_12858 [translate_table: standard]
MKIELVEIQALVSEMKNRLEGHPTNAPKLVEDWLGKVQNSLRTAQDIVDANGRLSLFSGLLKRRKLCKRTECWKRSIRDLLEKGNLSFSVIGNVERVISTVPDRSKRLLQPVPASGFVGEQINSGVLQLQNWVIHDDKTGLIAVVGMGGVGKTSLLKILNNNMESRPIKALQSSIAKRLNLALSEQSSEEERAMELSEALENQRFLLILDDCWEKIELENLGASHVCRGRGEKWKVVLSTRNDSLARTMNADRCIKMKMNFQIEPVASKLAWNSSLKEVPEGFLTNLNSLKVLDLSWTKIYSLPTSIGQLKNLESLSVRATPISNLPETICYLTRLEVLDVSCCRSLKSLPRMSELRRLKDLNLRDCSQLAFLPFEISELISLEMLDMEGCSSMSLQIIRNEATFSDSRMMASVKDLMNLTKLKDLGLRPSEEIAVGVMGSWTEMRSLVLERTSDQPEYLPEDMKEMKRLMKFALKYCGVVRMPDWIFGFQNLESLEFISCNSMKELGSLHRLPCLRRLKIHGNNIMTEMGTDFGRTRGFPALETLFLDSMCSLQSIVGSEQTRGMIEEGAMRSLQVLSVYKCMRLEKLPMGLEKLSSTQR